MSVADASIPNVRDPAARPAGGRAVPVGTTRADAADLLRASAFELFAVRGFDNVTVEEISAHAGVSPSTFYRRFGTKESVVLWDLEQVAQLILDALEAQPEGVSPSELVLGTAGTIAIGSRPFDFVDDIAELVGQQHDALRAHFELIFASIEEDISGLLARRFRGAPSDARIRNASSWFCATVRVTVLVRLEHGADEFAERVTPLFVDLAAALELALGPR
jgi:AcrR family transcriptional regulator